MDIEIVPPRMSDDGIVFYVSASGTKTGISISGLERLIGLTAYSVMFQEKRYPVFYRMSINAPQQETDSKWLKPAWGKVFDPSIKGSDGAKIVMAKAATCIIKEYAFGRQNETAMNSLDKFLEKGFDTWVKEVVNFATEPTLNSQLLEALKQMSDKLDSVASKVSKWDKIEGVTATIYPGMKMINDSLSVADLTKLLPTQELFTVREWLTMKGVVVDKSTLYSFARQAADTYKTMTGKRPASKTSTSKTTGKGQRNGNGYRVVDFTILQTAWETFVNKNLV